MLHRVWKGLKSAQYIWNGSLEKEMKRNNQNIVCPAQHLWKVSRNVKNICAQKLWYAWAKLAYCMPKDDFDLWNKWKKKCYSKSYIHIFLSKKNNAILNMSKENDVTSFNPTTKVKLLPRSKSARRANSSANFFKRKN